MSLIYFVLLTFLIAVAVGYVVIPRIVIIAKMKRLFDQPNVRKVHSEATPRLGGIPFFPGAMFAFAFVLGLRYYFGYELSLAREGDLMIEFLFVISGMFLLFFVGLSDDLIGVDFKIKFLVQAFAGLALAFAGLSIGNWGGIFGIWIVPSWLAVTVTVVLAVFLMNAFNLIDGVDGLCSGTGIIVLSLLGAWFVYLGEFVYSMFAFAMVGVVIVFFQFNIMGKRLKVFMGDTGSLTLGYMVVFLALKFISIDTDYYPDVYRVNSSLALFIGLLFVPVFDTLRVFSNRITRGKSPFYPDKTHIHHKLLELGFSHIQNTSLLLLAQIVFLLLTILLSEVLRLNINIVITVLFTCGVLINMIINKKITKIKLRNVKK